MNKNEEALKDIVCAMIASGDYTYKDSHDADWQTALNLGWNVVWYGQVVDHASELLAKIKDKANDTKTPTIPQDAIPLDETVKLPKIRNITKP